MGYLFKAETEPLFLVQILREWPHGSREYRY
jgi:hypothetical protein